MSEETLNNEAQKAELEKIERVRKSMANMIEKKSKFLFVIPNIENPNASMYEIYYHATAVKKMGYKVVILTEKEEYEVPKWVESELTEHEHKPMTKSDLTVGPEDVMVIPEVYSNVMEQTKNLPCLRVGLLQSVDYMLNSLVPGTDWTQFGIKKMITTSDTVKEFVEVFYGKNKFDIAVCNPTIPNYFKRTDEPQKPIVSIIGRNPNEVSKVVKLFFARYPQYRFLTFDPMLTKSKPPQPMRRKDFAERLRGNFAAIWIDRISTWGTFPLECMASGTVPICLKPDVTPEYILERDENGELSNKISENVGLWTDNLYDIPVMIGETLIKFLDDNISDETYDNMEKLVSNYRPEVTEKKLVEIYQGIIDERVKLFNDAIESSTDTPKE